MDTLPPVVLGATLAPFYLCVLLLRVRFAPRLVAAVPDPHKPRRQFSLDLAFLVVAGMAAALFNFLYHGFPLASGGSLVIGSVVAGFFAAVDMALHRERSVILRAMARQEVLPPPRQLFSMTRKFSLVAITTSLFTAVILILVFSRDIVWLSQIEQSPEALRQAQLAVTYEIVFILAALLALLVNLIISYSKNLKLLFENQTDVLETVSQGDFSRRVPVLTNDEFGLIAGHTNTMIDGLQDRSRLLTALKVAEEIQHNLLPRRPPALAAMDVAGTAIYCDETGGDYYDYLPLPDGRWGVVVADAADHGVGAALFMTTARAFLRYGALAYSSPAALLANVNRFLVRDSAETSRFVTMFFLEIDPGERSLRWVRAGHQPALVFDPQTGRLTTLAGTGMALGVMADYRFREYTWTGWKPGTIVLVGTDGIFEACNPAAEMFGIQRVHDILRQRAGEPAETIQGAIIAALQHFQGAAPQEDDITLVTIKLR